MNSKQSDKKWMIKSIYFVLDSSYYVYLCVTFTFDNYSTTYKEEDVWHCSDNGRNKYLPTLYSQVPKIVCLTSYHIMNVIYSVRQLTLMWKFLPRLANYIDTADPILFFTTGVATHTFSSNFLCVRHLELRNWNFS